MAKRFITGDGIGGTFLTPTHQYQLVGWKSRLTGGSSQYYAPFSLPAGRVHAAALIIGGVLTNLTFGGLQASPLVTTEHVAFSDDVTVPHPAGTPIEIVAYLQVDAGATGAVGMTNGGLKKGTLADGSDSDRYEGGATFDAAQITKVTTLGSTIANAVDQHALRPMGLIARDAPPVGDSADSVLYFGDSITNAFVTIATGGPGIGYPAYAGMFRGIGGVKCAQDGSQHQQGIDVLATAFFEHICPAGVPANNCVTHAFDAHGVNTCRDAVSQSAAYTTMYNGAHTLFAGTKARGLKGIVASVTPFEIEWSNSTSLPLGQAARHQWNNYLRTQAGLVARGTELPDLAGVNYFEDPDLIVGSQASTTASFLTEWTVAAKGSDGIHFNEDGHKLIASRIFQGIFTTRKPWTPQPYRARMQADGRTLDIQYALEPGQSWTDLAVGLPAANTVVYTPDASTPGTTIAANYAETCLIGGIPTVRFFMAGVHYAPITMGVVVRYNAPTQTITGALLPPLGLFRTDATNSPFFVLSTATAPSSSYTTFFAHAFGGSSGLPAGLEETQGYYEGTRPTTMAQDGSGFLRKGANADTDGVVVLAVTSATLENGRSSGQFGQFGANTRSFMVGARIINSNSVLNGGYWFTRGPHIKILFSAAQIIGRNGTVIGTYNYASATFGTTDVPGWAWTLQGDQITATITKNGAAINGAQVFTDPGYVGGEAGGWGAGVFVNAGANTTWGLDNLLVEQIVPDVTPPVITAPYITPGGRFLVADTNEAVSLPLLPSSFVDDGGLAISGNSLGPTKIYGDKGYVSPLGTRIYLAAAVPNLVFTQATMRDSAGNLVASSNTPVANNSLAPAPGPTAPPAVAPTVALTNPSSTSFRLTFSSAEAGVTGFDVEHNGVVSVGVASPQNYTIADPTTAHKWRVRATNSGGPGPWSSYVTLGGDSGSGSGEPEVTTTTLETLTTSWQAVATGDCKVQVRQGNSALLHVGTSAPADNVDDYLVLSKADLENFAIGGGSTLYARKAGADVVKLAVAK